MSSSTSRIKPNADGTMPEEKSWQIRNLDAPQPDLDALHSGLDALQPDTIPRSSVRQSDRPIASESAPVKRECGFFIREFTVMGERVRIHYRESDAIFLNIPGAGYQVGRVDYCVSRSGTYRTQGNNFLIAGVVVGLGRGQWLISMTRAPEVTDVIINKVDEFVAPDLYGSYWQRIVPGIDELRDIEENDWN